MLNDMIYVLQKLHVRRLKHFLHYHLQQSLMLFVLIQVQMILIHLFEVDVIIFLMLNVYIYFHHFLLIVVQFYLLKYHINAEILRLINFYSLIREKFQSFFTIFMIF